MSEGQAQLMSSLTHDLRGSLNGIVLMLEVLRRELVNKPQLAETLADVHLMQSSMKDAVSLMERHLYADRLRRNRIECRVQPLRLAPISREIVGGFAEQARAKGSDISARVPEDATVMADPELFRVAMQNLLDNAIKHAPAGRVEVSAQQQENTWLIEIRDPGEGLGADQLGRFLSPPAKSGVKFKGLGLVIAHNAARMCGGRLEADGNAPGGVFRLVLPSAP
jgi:signal transduction histidine kinase